HDVTGVGVAAAGFASPERDGMLVAPNIGWRGYPLRGRLSRGIDLPIVIEHAASAAGWAEFRFGARRTARALVMLTPRTGPGAALPVGAEHDANAAGWPEFRFGAGPTAQSMVMLTLGTGLGGAIILDDRLTRGAFGAAGELRHMRVVPSGHYCGCGHEGCWEMYASGRALTRAARMALITDEDRAGRLRELAEADGTKVKGQHVTQAAGEGDPLARELV